MKLAPSPRNHPNAYAAFSVGSVAALITFEAQERFGFKIHEIEAMFLASVVISVVLFFGKKVKPSGEEKNPGSGGTPSS